MVSQCADHFCIGIFILPNYSFLASRFSLLASRFSLLASRFSLTNCIEMPANVTAKRLPVNGSIIC
ncbi:hypothetical protein VCHENC02_0242A, partial [Vibrio harveyi]